MAKDSSGNDLAEDLQEAFSITKLIKSKFKKFGKKLFNSADAGAAPDAPPESAPESDAEIRSRRVKEAKERGDYYNPHQQIPRGARSPYAKTPNSPVDTPKSPYARTPNLVGNSNTGKKCRSCKKQIAIRDGFCGGCQDPARRKEEVD